MDLAQQRERSKIQALSDSQRKLEQAEERLREMQEYKLEYQKNMQRQGAQGISAGQWAQINSFLVQLDHIIEQQRQMIRQAENNVVLSRYEWIDANNRFTALHKAMESYQGKELKEEKRKEQNHMDDMFQNRNGRGDPMQE